MSNIDIDGLIDISYEPMGWAKEKEITITYNLYNNIDKPSNYIYEYEYDVDDNINSSRSFDNYTIIEKVTVNKNGTLYASIANKENVTLISNSQVISKIDNIKPKIEENYGGEYDVSGSVIIPIKLIDQESLIDGDSFTEDDLKVTIGGKEVANIALTKLDDNNYELTINDNANEGIVEITIDSNKIFDNVLNGNEETILTPLAKFSSKYIITLDNQYATTSGSTSVVARYNSSSISPSMITLPQRKYTVSGFATSDSRKSTGATISSTSALTATYMFNGWYNAATEGDKVIDNNANPSYVANVSGYTDVNKNWIRMSDETLFAQWTSSSITLPTITKSGYTCGWTTESNGTNIIYKSGDSYTPTKNITMYAVCTANSVYIKYNTNGGTITSSTTSSDGKTVYSWKTDIDGIIYSGESLYKQTIKYDSSDDLKNYDNGNYIYITKTDYIAEPGAEWVCIEGCSTANKTFNQTTNYSASDFCDASEGDCTVEIGVNWKSGNKINSNRYSCHYYNDYYRLAVYYVTTCVDGKCSYTKKFGLDSTFDFSNDWMGIPTWNVDESILATSPDGTDGCKKWQYWVAKANIGCYAGANKNTDLRKTFGSGKCEEFLTGLYITTYRTYENNELKNWFYYPRYNCYIYRGDLENDCSGGSDAGGTGNGWCGACSVNKDCASGMTCKTNACANSTTSYSCCVTSDGMSCN